jgi:hypothetical protein
VSAIPLPSLEEEASAEHSAVLESPRNGSGNSRFSRAGHAVEPEDGLGGWMMSPFVDLAKKVDAHIGVVG